MAKYLTIELNDMDQIFHDLIKKVIEIKINLWHERGDRHFAIQDSNGIGIDIVKYSPNK